MTIIFIAYGYCYYYTLRCAATCMSVQLLSYACVAYEKPTTTKSNLCCARLSFPCWRMRARICIFFIDFFAMKKINFKIVAIIFTFTFCV